MSFVRSMFPCAKCLAEVTTTEVPISYYFFNRNCTVRRAINVPDAIKKKKNPQLEVFIPEEEKLVLSLLVRPFPSQPGEFLVVSVRLTSEGVVKSRNRETVTTT